MNALTLLGGLSADEFLSQYWQKKPLLIRQAFATIDELVCADELAGLACDEDVEARIILEKDGTHPWQLRSGPFSETDFAQLPDTHWTLLIQDMEKHLPELSSIVSAFDFIPDWRMDDLMFSYAPAQGSVGPHVDAYDVFLLQAAGQRHWQINTRIQDTADTLDNCDLNILSFFESEQDWVLEPGDMLYLPPNVAHYGVALNDCITCSIGFRAPGHQGLVQGYTHTALERINKQILYSDPDLKPQKHTHELTSEQIAALKQTVMQYLELDDHAIQSWLGSALSEAKESFQPDPLEDPLSEKDWLVQWRINGVLYRNTAIKFLFIRNDKHITLFINATEFELPPGTKPDLVEWMCSTLQIQWHDYMSLSDRDLITPLLYQCYCDGFYYLA